MENNIIDVKRAGLHMQLYQYIDFHRYEIVFEIRVFAKGEEYIERHFKSFAAACNYFNKECTKRGAQDWIIW